MLEQRSGPTVVLGTRIREASRVDLSLPRPVGKKNAVAGQLSVPPQTRIFDRQLSATIRQRAMWRGQRIRHLWRRWRRELAQGRTRAIPPRRVHPAKKNGDVFFHFLPLMCKTLDSN